MDSSNTSNTADLQRGENKPQAKTCEPTLMRADEMMETEQENQKPVLAGTAVCSEQATCDKAKPEQDDNDMFCEPDYVYVSAAPFMLNPEGDHLQAEELEAPAIRYIESICPFCGLSSNLIVTICCRRPESEDSTRSYRAMAVPPEEGQDSEEEHDLEDKTPYN